MTWEIDAALKKRVRGERAPRLAQLARAIERAFPDLLAVAEPNRGFCNTDRKIPGTRLRHLGKGRRGTLLTVKLRSTAEVVYQHNAAETYRDNWDVVRWMGEERTRRRRP